MGWADLDPKDRGRIVRATMVFAALGVVVIAFTYIAGLVGDNADPELGQVMFPEAGEAQASLLNNGGEAWVVVTVDELQVVLSAVSPDPSEEPSLVEWCPEAQAFVDLVSGTLWDSQGRYVAGPANHDLARYDFTAGEEGTAVLTGIAEPGDRSEGQVPDVPCDAGMSTSFDP